MNDILTELVCVGGKPTHTPRQLHRGISEEAYLALVEAEEIGCLQAGIKLHRRICASVLMDGVSISKILSSNAMKEGRAAKKAEHTINPFRARQAIASLKAYSKTRFGESMGEQIEATIQALTTWMNLFGMGYLGQGGTRIGLKALFKPQGFIGAFKHLELLED